MGGHGGLNILPEKRWHVYNKDNRLKVALDEAKQREREAAVAEQEQRARQELRYRILAGNASQRAEDASRTIGGDVTQMVSNGCYQASRDAGAEQHEVHAQQWNSKRHVNLFEEEELLQQNQERLAEEQAAKRRRGPRTEEHTSDPKFDEKFQFAYGFRDSTPWYASHARCIPTQRDVSSSVPHPHKQVAYADPTWGGWQQSRAADAARSHPHAAVRQGVDLALSGAPNNRALSECGAARQSATHAYMADMQVMLQSGSLRASADLPRVPQTHVYSRGDVRVPHVPVRCTSLGCLVSGQKGSVQVAAVKLPPTEQLSPGSSPAGHPGYPPRDEGHVAHPNDGRSLVKDRSKSSSKREHQDRHQDKSKEKHRRRDSSGKRWHGDELILRGLMESVDKLAAERAEREKREKERERQLLRMQSVEMQGASSGSAYSARVGRDTRRGL